MVPAGLSDLRPPSKYVLPDAARSAFAGSFGHLTDTEGLPNALEGASVVLAVGDVVAVTLHSLGIRPRLFVCDYATQRGATGDPDAFRRVLGAWGDQEFKVENPPATITRTAWTAIQKALAAPVGVLSRIVVEGEEDMLGVPCFLEAPVGAKVIYGSPGRGVIVVTIDEAFQAAVRAKLDLLVKE